jgi:hypothetical protein
MQAGGLYAICNLSYIRLFCRESSCCRAWFLQLGHLWWLQYVICYWQSYHIGSGVCLSFVVNIELSAKIVFAFFGLCCAALTHCH